MDFQIIGTIDLTEVIASGRGVKIRERLNEEFGKGRWRKLKGMATIRYSDGRIRRAELHWFEAHGVGRKYLKVKRHIG